MTIVNEGVFHGKQTKTIVPDESEWVRVGSMLDQKTAIFDRDKV